MLRFLSTSDCPRRGRSHAADFLFHHGAAIADLALCFDDVRCSTAEPGSRVTQAALAPLPTRPAQAPPPAGLWRVSPTVPPTPACAADHWRVVPCCASLRSGTLHGIRRRRRGIGVQVWSCDMLRD